MVGGGAVEATWVPSDCYSRGRHQARAVTIMVTNPTVAGRRVMPDQLTA